MGSNSRYAPYRPGLAEYVEDYCAARDIYRSSSSISNHTLDNTHKYLEVLVHELAHVADFDARGVTLWMSHRTTTMKADVKCAPTDVWGDDGVPKLEWLKNFGVYTTCDEIESLEEQDLNELQAIATSRVVLSAVHGFDAYRVISLSIEAGELRTHNARQRVYARLKTKRTRAQADKVLGWLLKEKLIVTR